MVDWCFPAAWQFSFVVSLVYEVGVLVTLEVTFVVDLKCVSIIRWHVIFPTWCFLGGLSLHLNHLITSRMANYDWPFGTLPFELFGSNLDTRDLETYPRTYSGHF